MGDKRPGKGPKAKNKDRRRVPESAASAARPEKLPRVEAALDFYSLKPTWSFSFLDVWWVDCGWVHLEASDPDNPEANELLNRMREFEKLTWAEILMARRDPHHRISVEAIEPFARKRLRDLRLDDHVEEVVSLRINSTARVFGVLHGGTLRILWWDPHHRICPSPPKNT